MKYPIFFVAPLLLLVGILLLSSSNSKTLPDPAQSRWINLTLRQIGHDLLSAQCDSTSVIPRVSRGADGRYLLQLERQLDYDLLVDITNRRLHQSSYPVDYTIAIEDCQSAELLLGFRWSSAVPSPDPACTGRDQAEGCHNISLTIHPREDAVSPVRGVSGGIALLSGIALLFVGWPRYSANPTREEKASDSLIILSPKTTLDDHNLVLLIAGEEEPLTYRESQLLAHLSRHANLILDREDIKSAVWESEGIITGRSLDVFISRLRKKLAKDPSIEIETIRGRGYRLKTNQ